MNKHIQFWLTIGSLGTLLILFVFMLYMGVVESITFQKGYCIFCLPSLIYLGWQFVINYCELTNDKE